VIFHVAFESDWQAAERAGEYRVSTVGRSLDDEGFIHASHEHQVDGVLRRYYSDVAEPLVLLGIDPGLLGCEVREEAPPGSPERFPHIYGPIPAGAVVDVRPVDPGAQPGSRRNSPPASDIT
jgi:uncharacterized protein (DUF952 family)